MKNALLLLVASIACAAILFVPHHRRGPDSFTPNTLGGLYSKLFADLPERWNAERLGFLALLLAGVFATIAPVVLALMLRWHRPAEGAAGGVAYGIVGAIAGFGAAANFFLIVLSNTSFAFGGRPVPGDVVAFAWIVAGGQLVVALASLAISVSSRCASFAS